MEFGPVIAQRTIAYVDHRFSGRRAPERLKRMHQSSVAMGWRSQQYASIARFPAILPLLVAALKILHYLASDRHVPAAPMPTARCTDEIITLKEVAGYLKVTERTIYRLAAAKQIPTFKVGGTWRFALADIEVWIRRQSRLIEGGRSGSV